MLPDIASCRAFAFDVYSLFIGCEAFNGNQLNKVVLAVVVFGVLRVAGQARLHWHHDWQLLLLPNSLVTELI